MMTMITEATFSEFIQFIHTHPTWRRRLRQALFPDLDLDKAFRELAESRRQLQKALQELTGSVVHVEQDVAVLKSDMRQVRHDVADLKGFNYESRIIQRADAVFGRFMRRGHDARHELGDLLEQAEEDGVITELEHDHVLALDLLWGGKQKGSKSDIVLAIEVSWRVEKIDMTRAVARAATLRKMGLTALPVVAGLVWEADMIDLAREHHTVCIINMTVDNASWQSAIGSC